MSFSFLIPTNAMRVSHRRADIFGESFLAPGDARRFVGWRVVETLERAALAAIDAVKGWAELDFGSPTRAQDPVLRDIRQPRDLSRRLDGEHGAGCDPLRHGAPNHYRDGQG
jgi:hypothetical protein